eukprot:TRINITY_DN47954_c0_g1_i1.p1 TRINITY_DN47954_c0_g1~~TRINITY_DN47954_c0_g1_i1.p1  ORF type:complete len:361 (+),score=66.29 TRINITY_DN47954_c0_g1_i1:3-1085(+)
MDLAEAEIVERNKLRVGLLKDKDELVKRNQAKRDTWLRSLMLNPKAERAVGKIRRFYKDARVGRHGRRALRRDLFFLWKEQAAQKVSEVRDAVKSTSQSLSKAMRQDLLHEYVEQRARLDDLEITNRTALKTSEEDKREALYEGFHEGCRSIATDKSLYALEMSEVLKRKQVGEEEEVGRQVLKMDQKNALLLVMPMHGPAVRVIEEFYANVKKGKIGKNARVLGLRFTLRRTREIQIQLKMQGLSAYVSELNDILLQEEDVATERRIIVEKQRRRKHARDALKAQSENRIKRLEVSFNKSLATLSPSAGRARGRLKTIPVFALPTKSELLSASMSTRQDTSLCWELEIDEHNSRKVVCV